MILAPEIETRPWDEQRAADDAAYREQVAYLLDRSPFYREKLGVADAAAAGGLDAIGDVPPTEKQELRASVTPENPIGAHLCASRDEIAHRIRAARGKLPGFGHPVHRPLDPRAERILELADARGAGGPNVALARAFRDAAAEAWGRPLTMNVAMPIAAVMLDLGFPAASVKAVPILARTGGLLAHLAEEQQQPLGFLMASHAEEAVTYERKTAAGADAVES